MDPIKIQLINGPMHGGEIDGTTEIYVSKPGSPKEIYVYALSRFAAYVRTISRDEYEKGREP